MPTRDPFRGPLSVRLFAAGATLCATTMPCLWAEPVETPGAKRTIEWLAQRGPQQELADARTKWTSRAVGEYEFTFQARCFCDPEFLRPVTFRVTRDGSVLLTPVDDRVRKSLDRFNTVERLFDFVQSAIDKRAYKLTVTYDEEFAYPRSVRVDYRQMTKDEEMAFTVTDFRVLEEDARR